MMNGKKTIEIVTLYNTDVKNWPLLRELKAMTPEEATALEAALAKSRVKNKDSRVYEARE